MKPIFSHIIDPRNIGDQSCCPRDLIHEFNGFHKVPIQDIEVDGSTSPVIFGGGGIIHGSLIPKLEAFSKDKSRKRIIWGAGLNIHGSMGMPEDFPKFLDDFDLVGLRDYRNKWNYVPCPSCLNPLFDRTYQKKHDIVIFEHFQHPIDLQWFPRMNNNQPGWYLFEVLKFIGSSRVLITNSYHGAYWALLMGVSVVIWNPFSSRFFGLKPLVAYCYDGNWKSSVKAAYPPPSEYLKECRTINQEFYEKVKEVLSL